MGGVFPLTVRLVAGRPRPGGPRRRQRLRPQHPRRHRRLVRLGLRGAAGARARARHLRRRAASGWRWRRAVPGGARRSPRRRRLRGRGAGGGAGASAGSLLPRWNLVNLLAWAFSASRSPRTTSSAATREEDLGEARAGLLRGRRLHHRLGRPVGQDLLDEEQRQGRRLQRRRHADPDHGRPAAAAALSPRRGHAPAAGGPGRLRLGRHRRRDDPVPHRLARGGRARARGLPGRALLRRRQPPPARRTRGSPPGWATAATSSPSAATASTSSSASPPTPGSPACRTCSRASTSATSARAWPTAASSASGRSSTRWRPGT